MHNNAEETKKKIADYFIQSLRENSLQWKKNWIDASPLNAVTGKYYRGINKFLLSMEAQKANSLDYRWATFNQIKNAGWSVRKGAKGSKIQYCQPYDFTVQKQISWEEYRAKGHYHIGIIYKNFTVFNGQDIRGIPPLETISKNVVTDELLHKISNSMEVTIQNNIGGDAFYHPLTDTIHVPIPERFSSSYDYNSTVLHELSHATGSQKRLQRNLTGAFGSPEYAYEELVAEISSSFMGVYLEINQSKEHLQNHAAYVQHWIQEIQRKPETLLKAIQDAEEVSTYLEYHAGLLTREAYLKERYGFLNDTSVKNRIEKELREKWISSNETNRGGNQECKSIDRKRTPLKGSS